MNFECRKLPRYAVQAPTSLHGQQQSSQCLEISSVESMPEEMDADTQLDYGASVKFSWPAEQPSQVKGPGRVLHNNQHRWPGPYF